MAGEFDDLLSECVYRVGDGAKQGTGFAVSSTLLVTCRHVVEDVPPGGAVAVYPAGAADAIPTVVKLKVPRDDDERLLAPVQTAEHLWPDFALLERSDGGAFPLAVLLDSWQPEEPDEVRVGGFGRTWVGYDTNPFTTGSRVNLDNSGHVYSRLRAESVDKGLSGSAVLTADGFVCGHVSASRAEASPLGGYFLPLHAVLDELDRIAHDAATPAEQAVLLERLGDLHDHPDAASRRWLERISPAALTQRNRNLETGFLEGARYLPPAVLDLAFEETTVAGEDRRWAISVGGLPESPTWSLHDLGDDLFDALDNWARRNQLATEEQVTVLGRVLDRALLPEPIKKLREAQDQRRPPLVRLLADPANPLTAIPWEYAAELATSRSWVFSRYVETGKGALQPKDSIRVLVVVNDVDGVSRDALVAAATAIQERLASSPAVEARVETGVDLRKFNTLVRDAAGWDVVHLVSTATTDGQFIFPSEDVWGSTTYVDFRDMRVYLAASHAKAVVFQLGSPRFEPPAPLSVFLSVLTNEVQGVPETDVRALVVGQHIATSNHASDFGKEFYKDLLLGESVEHAVQFARGELRQVGPPSPRNPTQQDKVAFGAVCVVTTAEGDVRLLTPPATSDEQGTGHQAPGAQSPGTTSGAPAPTGGPTGAPAATARPSPAAPHQDHTGWGGQRT
ncbi:serine protease [Microbacterium sp. NPDC019599]|uniref:S1 family peptidase n=1 Tax=Microbacterium sp. NPDC019599 TaxID=3154690 RepID=UPI0033DE486B